MTPPMPRNRPLSASIAILALGATVSGCFNPFSPRIGTERGVSVPAVASPMARTLAGSSPGWWRRWSWTAVRRPRGHGDSVC